MVVASNDKLAASLSDKLSCVGAAPSSAAASLGVDLAAGKKRRTHGKNSVRSARFKKGMARIARIRILRRAVGGSLAAVITRAGPVAATQYGASVNGVSDTELMNLRTLEASGMTLAAQGRS